MMPVIVGGARTVEPQTASRGAIVNRPVRADVTQAALKPRSMVADLDADVNVVVSTGVKTTCGVCVPGWSTVPAPSAETQCCATPEANTVWPRTCVPSRNSTTPVADPGAAVIEGFFQFDGDMTVF